MEEDQAFREWLARKSWTQAVRYSKAIAVLLPPAALAAQAAHFHQGQWAATPVSTWLLAWQVTAELVAIGVILIDRFAPRWRGREWLLHLFSLLVALLATSIGVSAGWQLRPDLSLYAAGMTFLAAVVSTPLPVRRPMYAASLAVLAMAAWNREGEAAATVAALVSPFCVILLCIQLDRFTYSRNLELFRETRRADAERARADKVLYNVLPASIADELKRDDKVSAVKFENMGVLFADIAGFTGYSRSLPPNALVLVLNEIFSSFDALVDRHALEKIKTIGDAYMATSSQRIDALCELALDMREAIARYNRANGTTLAMRIGIHVGPAVAGVIGIKRFLYDVWGDTVNVASRMEASGEPGLIHVTEAVARQASGGFRFEAREPIEVKGRGTMATYWLNGRQAGPLAA